MLPQLDAAIAGLRVGVATGYFHAGAQEPALAALETVAAALGPVRPVVVPEAARARAAAYVITTTEGAALHLARLRNTPAAFDPDVRDRLIAGAMLPAAFVAQAQKFRRWYRDAVLALFAEVDIILAPATPCEAPPIGTKTLLLDGREVPLRPNIGIFTQPISFIGRPVVAVPVPLPGRLPVAVQLIAAPWREDLVLRVAHALERRGVVAAPRPGGTVG